jgi:hypothetical protein
MTASGSWIATIALPCAVPTTVLTAETVTYPRLGAVAGAVYRPALVMVPTLESPPEIPFTCHATDWLAVPVTVAWNCCDPPGCRLAAIGATLTVTLGTAVGVAVRVRTALPVAVAITVRLGSVRAVALLTMVAVAVAAG